MSPPPGTDTPITSQSPATREAVEGETTQSDVIASNDAVASTEEVKGDGQSAPQEGLNSPEAASQSALPPQLGSKTADRLLLFDSLLIARDAARSKEYMELYAKFMFPNATLESFEGFDGFVQKLWAYRSIRELLLYIHGEAGGLAIEETHGRKQRPMPLIVQENFQNVAPQVTDRVILESCVVAQDPSRTMLLKKLFQTPKVIGWNYYHVLDRRPMKLQGNVSAAQITTMIACPPDYLLPGMPQPETYAGQTGTFTLLYEWFRDREDAMPPGPTPDRAVFPTRADALPITLTTQEAACMPRCLKDPSQVLDENGAKDLAALCNKDDNRGLVEALALVTIADPPSP